MENIMQVLNNFPKTATRLDWCEVDGVVFEYEVVEIAYEYDDMCRVYPDCAAVVKLLTVNNQQPTEEVQAKFQDLVDTKRLIIDMAPW